MSVFTDALDLRTAVVENTNDTIVDVWPRLVAQAENQINYRLRVREMIKGPAIVTFVNGIAPFPSDFLELIDLSRNQFDSSHQSGIAFERMNQSNVRGSFLYSEDNFTVTGDGFKMTGFEGERNIFYYAKMPSLAGSLSASNDILQKYPDLYENAVTMRAAKYIKDLNLFQVYQALFAEEISLARQQSNAERFGAAKVRVNGATP